MSRLTDDVWAPGGRFRGHIVVYQLRDDIYDDECCDCAAGVCVQRVESCDELNFRTVQHREQRRLN